MNSNAQQVTINAGKARNGNPGYLQYITIGGVLDIYFVLGRFFFFHFLILFIYFELIGPQPDQVVSQYTEIVGRPMFPPFWSLGWHQCRWVKKKKNYQFFFYLFYFL